MGGLDFPTRCGGTLSTRNASLPILWSWSNSCDSLSPQYHAALEVLALRLSCYRPTGATIRAICDMTVPTVRYNAKPSYFANLGIQFRPTQQLHIPLWIRRKTSVATKTKDGECDARAHKGQRTTGLLMPELDHWRVSYHSKPAMELRIFIDGAQKDISVVLAHTSNAGVCNFLPRSLR